MAKGDLSKRLGNPTPLSVPPPISRFTQTDASHSQRSRFVPFVLDPAFLRSHGLDWSECRVGCHTVVRPFCLTSPRFSEIVPRCPRTQPRFLCSGSCYFIGGVGLYLAGILEFILGNTFPFGEFFASSLSQVRLRSNDTDSQRCAVVFCSFGGFWSAYGFFIQPTQAIAEAAGGATTLAYNNGFAIYLLSWAAVTLIYLVASLRTSVLVFLSFCTTLISILRTGMSSLFSCSSSSRSHSTYSCSLVRSFLPLREAMLTYCVRLATRIRGAGQRSADPQGSGSVRFPHCRVRMVVSPTLIVDFLNYN